ncbi:hypothetical protein [Corynebacterium caspium]|uniref:hypothetical protein n=1 Tax=Corynebacterium caspium TaxID=234828 RepID=UPI000361AEFD|nr:hypothetical protein [Corynebacterium caspium]WKD59563.1 hypothetical protein CCASP_05880 [Corynebacterium caspium DSM 44850]
MKLRKQIIAISTAVAVAGGGFVAAPAVGAETLDLAPVEVQAEVVKAAGTTPGLCNDHRDNNSSTSESGKKEWNCTPGDKFTNVVLPVIGGVSVAIILLSLIYRILDKIPSLNLSS